MALKITIPGLSPSGKVPGVQALVLLGQGPVNPGSIPRLFLVVGTKLASGSVAPDTSVVDITPVSNLDAMFGARSEIAQMIRQAQRIDGIQIKAACVAEAGGAVSAIATITYATNATTAGTWVYYVSGERIEVNVAANDTPAQQATKCVAAFAAKGLLPCTAAAVAGVVTLTIASAGARGNHHTLYKDNSLKPGGTTDTLGSTSTYVVRPGDDGETGVRFGGGVGTDDVSTLLSTLSNRTYFTIAVPHTDATNLGRWKAWNIAQGGINQQRYQSLVCASNDLESVFDPIAISTLNDGTWSAVWVRGSEDHPGVIAAGAAGIFHQIDQLHPNTPVDGVVIPGLHKQRASVDRPSGGDTGEQSLRLDNGVTPCTSTDDGKVVIIRAITTWCREKGQPFDGCIDRGQMRAPYVGAELVSFGWSTDYAVKNKWVNSDPENGEKDRGEGVATPTFWKSYAYGLLAAKIEENWFSKVTVNATYQNKQIVTSIDVEVTPQNHRMAFVMKQVNPPA